MVWAPIAIRGPVFGLRAWTPFVFRGPVFGFSLSSAGLFLDSLCLPRACFYTSFVFRGRVFGPPFLCGFALGPFVFFCRHVFGLPLSSATVLFLCSLCLPRSFIMFLRFVFGRSFLDLRWLPGLFFGHPPASGSSFWALWLPGVVLEFLWLPGARSWTFCMASRAGAQTRSSM